MGDRSIVDRATLLIRIPAALAVPRAVRVLSPGLALRGAPRAPTTWLRAWAMDGPFMLTPHAGRGPNAACSVADPPPSTPHMVLNRTPRCGPRPFTVVLGVALVHLPWYSVRLATRIYGTLQSSVWATSKYLGARYLPEMSTSTMVLGAYHKR